MQNLLSENRQLKTSTRLYKIFLISLFILVPCLVVFAYIQRQEAIIQRTISEDLMEQLQQSRAIAEQSRIEASMQKDMAEKSEMMCKQALLACEQGSK